MNIKTPLQILTNYDFRLKDFRTDKETQILYEQNDVIEAIESYHSQFEDKWISVEDRLPENKGFYLTIVDKSVASTLRGQIEIQDCYESVLDGFQILKFQDYVTHWKNLPSLPSNHK